MDEGTTLEAVLGLHDFERPAEVIMRVVRAVREHLGMDVAFVAELAADEQVFRFIDGDAGSLDVLAREDEPSSMPGRQGRHVGEGGSEQPDRVATIGVPIRAESGRAFGTLCCIGRSSEAHLGEAELRFLKVLAQLIGEQLEADEAAADGRRRRHLRVARLMEADTLGMQFQPIVDLRDGRVVGIESLARFATEPRWAPDVWFKEAWEVGLGVELEVHAVRTALAALGNVPSGSYLSVNVSPSTITTEEFQDAMDDAAGDNVVIELTEHAPVHDYAEIGASLGRLRERGVRLAIDDAGAGFASLRHILRLAPDMIKLDVTLTGGIEADPVRNALASSLVLFAGRIGATITAEGIESQHDLDALRSLGVGFGQGYYLARPRNLPLDMAPAPHLFS
jgi:EAL domain-containing protein (putative c-di-GMP-specific phosphodiesterase class I)